MLPYKSGKTRKVYVEFTPRVRVELWNDRRPRPYAHYHPGPESLRRLQAVCQAHAGRVTHYDGLIVYDELRGVVEIEKGVVLKK